MKLACLVAAIAILGTVTSANEKRKWNKEAVKQLRKAIYRRNNKKPAKNVIFFLGDAMGPSTVTASRFYLAQSRNISLKDAALAWETFQNVALSKTYAVDRMTTDSAAAGTAYLCGVKSKFGTIGTNQNVVKGDCTTLKGNTVKSIAKRAAAKGKWTGVVTTTRVTHASPAANYANSVHRNWEAYVPNYISDRHLCTDIAKQMVENHKNLRVVMGGGRKVFLPIGANPFAKRIDGVDLINEWKEKKKEEGLSTDEYAFMETKQDLDNVDVNKVKYMLGLFADNHMDYEVDRIRRPKIIQPSLADMTEKAIRVLQKGPKGFFLFVEGGRIDHAHHYTNAFRALNETAAMHDAVKRAVEITKESETLIIVSADHSTAMTMGGYPRTDKSILGLVGEQEMVFGDRKPATTLMYANGPGYYSHRMADGKHVPRKDLTNVDTEDIDYRQDAGVASEYETHGGEDVAIYARGPMSYLFHGVQEQNYIAHVIMHALCVGPMRRHCKAGS